MEETRTEDGETKTTTHAYDANGNLIKSVKDETETTTRAYDGFGEQVSFRKNGIEVFFRYRPDGLRHSKQIIEGTANRITTHYWDKEDIVLETNAGDSIKAAYIRGLQLVAQRIGDQQYYYTHNGHGDVVQRVDSSGNVLKSYNYDAFGNILNPATTGDPENPLFIDQNPFGYCGEYLDRETQEIYLRARYYDSSTGRFGQEDPIKSGQNWYAYCGGNPVKYVDSLGLYLVYDDYGGGWTEVNLPKTPVPKKTPATVGTGRNAVGPNLGGEATQATAPAGGSGNSINWDQLLYIATQGIADPIGMSGQGYTSLGIPKTQAETKSTNFDQYHNDTVPSNEPPPTEVGYVPPKSKGPLKKVPSPNGRGYGWPDENGGVWIPDNKQHGGAGWTVQYPGGRHIHVYPDGKTRHNLSLEVDWQQVLNVVLAVSAIIAIVILILDDGTGIGVGDDFLILPLIGFVANTFA